MFKIQKTKMLNRYFLNFIVRLFIFISVLSLFIKDKPFMISIVRYPLYEGITLLHIVWFFFMAIMLSHLFPTEKLTMALLKSKKETYVKQEGYSEIELLRFVQDMNIKAWMVMLVWLCFNAVIGILYLFHILDDADLFMITVFFFLSDYLCILFFCPFQTLIMKNRCCVNCRIFDWGHFMMFTPMLFIRNFFCWSLFFTSVVVLIHWEIVYAKHPERFWSGSNQTIQCSKCKDKTCQVKNQIKSAVKKDSAI